MEGAPTTISGVTSTSSSPAVFSSSGGLESFSSASGTTSVVLEHTPLRRRLVKASSIIAKRDSGATGVGGTGPPGFGSDRSASPSHSTSSGTSSGSAGTIVGVPSSTAATVITGTFRERAGVRPLGKGDAQGEFLLLPSHGAGGSSGPAKLGRPPIVPSPGIMGEVRPLGRRTELNPQRRHELTLVQKHAPEDLRIQQAKRVCLSRAQAMGATGNYKNFDSPFGNYMVPVIPNHLFNKTPTSSLTPSSLTPSPSSPVIGR